MGFARPSKKCQLEFYGVGINNNCRVQFSWNEPIRQIPEKQL